MLIGGVGVGMFGSRNTLPLSSVLASCCVDLDATLSASYGGSGQTWSNMITAPADGSAQTDFDMNLGSSSSSGGDDPTFTGTANSNTAYFALNGSQFFSLKNGSNPALYAHMHIKSGGNQVPFWALLAANNPSDSNKTFWGTRHSGSFNGLSLTYTAGGIARLTQAGSASASSSDDVTNIPTGDVIVLVSGDMSLTSNNVRFWVNTRTKTQNSYTPNAATANAADFFHLCCDGNAAGILANGWKIRTFAAGNTLIGDSSAALLFNAINSRHGITYA